MTDQGTLVVVLMYSGRGQGSSFPARGHALSPRADVRSSGRRRMATGRSAEEEDITRRREEHADKG